MISIQNLSKAYRHVHALSDVSLEIRPGQVTGVLGPNGCGKTTLIKCILGLVVPDTGVIAVAGESVGVGYQYRRKIGYMPQNADFPSNLRIDELLDMLEDIRGTNATRRNELIELFGLGPHINRQFGVLSGGTKQKVAAVAAFMFDPEVLILDEPTVGLDPVAVVKLKSLIHESATRGRSVLLVTHIIREIEQLVQEMFFLLEGHVSLSGTLDSILKEGNSEKLEDAVVKLIHTRSSSEKRVRT